VTSAQHDEYPIEIACPDISAYQKGNTGVDWVTSFEADAPGPHVMISALVHGNEICGAATLDWLFRQSVRPRRGRLTLGFMNVAAYRAFDPREPTASRFVDQDFNRVWQAESLDGHAVSSELARARAVRPVIETVDLLLDLHSMQHKRPPLMMAGPVEKGRALARRIGVPEWIVVDRGHAEGTRMRDYGGFADPSSAKNAVLFEAGQHWEADTIPRSIEVAIRFLRTVEAVEPAFGADFLAERPIPVAQRAIEVVAPVTIETASFVFAEDYRGMEVIERAGTLIARDGPREIRTPHDDCVLIMPSRRLEPGKTAVRLGRFL
jgi:predicted deacylase